MDKTLSRIVELVWSKRSNRKNLADYLGISPNVISDWKSGKNKSYPKYIVKISCFFGVSLDWLLGLSDEKTPPADNGGGSIREELISRIRGLSQDQLKQADSYVRWLESSKEE